MEKSIRVTTQQYSDLPKELKDNDIAFFIYEESDGMQDYETMDELINAIKEMLNYTNENID